MNSSSDYFILISSLFFVRIVEHPVRLVRRLLVEHRAGRFALLLVEYLVHRLL